MILGAVRDPDFNFMIMLGSGGTEIEGLKDIAFAVPPIDQNDLEHLFETTWAGRKLDGYRNIRKADKELVVDHLLKLEMIMNSYPEIEQIEFNPMIVYPEGQGISIVDARIKVNPDLI